MNKKQFFLTIFMTMIVTVVLMTAAALWALGLDADTAKNAVRFVVARRFIETQYVNEVDDKKLTDGAISGMMKSLDDPHSLYLDSEMYKALREHTESSFGGIGVVMGVRDGKIVAISVMEDNPGAKAGLKADDQILAVDGESVTDMELDKVVMKVRGEAGTDVVLTIHREGEEDRDYKITRGTIKVKTAAGKMQDDGIGYIRITSFGEDTAEEFDKEYKKLSDAGMKGLIIDLRENPGGLVKTCTDIAKTLVPKGPIVSVVRRDGSTEEYTSDLDAAPMPIVVLIDKNSASASEILAGALKDTGAATLVGTKSYGKGSVQIVMPLVDDDALKLTIAKYYTPSGVCIDGTGIEPDVPISFDMDAAAAGKDVQLEKAMEVMREKL